MIWNFMAVGGGICVQKERLAKSQDTGRGEQGRLPYLDTEPAADRSRPTGPFTEPDAGREGDVLLFVPRNEISRTIDRVTGGYGYSHMAIDCGERDEPTGRPVMVEATVGSGVHYSFQDVYGKRAFVRLPLREIGVDEKRFCECVRSKVGEKFDDIEAISLGLLDNPARQICSDLATVCLPDELHDEIARCHKRAVIHPLAAAQRGASDPSFRLFLSPNGFAEFLGAPRGGSLAAPEQRAVPHVQCRGEGVGILDKMRKRISALFRGPRTGAGDG